MSPEDIKFVEFEYKTVPSNYGKIMIKWRENMDKQFLEIFIEASRNEKIKSDPFNLHSNRFKLMDI